MCSVLLQTGNCSAGESCDFSHDLSPERVPTCLHFLRGRCSKPACRYVHVRVNPSSLVCRDFAILGYCWKGALCNEHHIHECPDWSNTGACHNKRCTLPHVDRAGQIRKHTAVANNVDASITITGNTSGDETSSDLSSDEQEHDEIDSDDVDSDSFDNDATLRSENGDADIVWQQDDFVHF